MSAQLRMSSTSAVVVGSQEATLVQMMPRGAAVEVAREMIAAFARGSLRAVSLQSQPTRDDVSPLLVAAWPALLGEIALREACRRASVDLDLVVRCEHCRALAGTSPTCRAHAPGAYEEAQRTAALLAASATPRPEACEPIEPYPVTETRVTFEGLPRGWQGIAVEIAHMIDRGEYAGLVVEATQRGKRVTLDVTAERMEHVFDLIERCES